jgi:hypothetical protein
MLKFYSRILSRMSSCIAHCFLSGTMVTPPLSPNMPSMGLMLVHPNYCSLGKLGSLVLI